MQRLEPEDVSTGQIATLNDGAVVRIVVVSMDEIVVEASAGKRVVRLAEIAEVHRAVESTGIDYERPGLHVDESQLGEGV